MMIPRSDYGAAKLQGKSEEESAKELARILFDHFKRMKITRSEAYRMSGIGETSAYRAFHPYNPRCMSVRNLKALKAGTGIPDKITDPFLYVKRPSESNAKTWAGLVSEQLQKLDISGNQLSRLSGVSQTTVNAFLHNNTKTAHKRVIAKLKPYLNLSDQQEQQFTF